jgi:Ca2+-binding EF-hand superfamily protein
MDKGNADEVNYFDFCNDVDSPEDMFGVGRDFNHSTNYFPKMQPRKVETDITKDDPEDLDDVIAMIRKKCKEQRIRVGEFFRDFDKLRSGFITINQLRIGLNMAKIQLSKPEFALIVDGFKAQ